MCLYCDNSIIIPCYHLPVESQNLILLIIHTSFLKIKPNEHLSRTLNADNCHKRVSFTQNIHSWILNDIIVVVIKTQYFINTTYIFHLSQLGINLIPKRSQMVINLPPL